MANGDHTTCMEDQFGSEAIMSDSQQYGIETDSMTLQRFVLAEQKNHPEASGDFTNLLTSLLTAVKAISSATQKAGLAQL
ncbi:hypothetical protein TELCIR_10832 [Teladorsagia circumcincta]|uniref:Fructose-1-6-bisphosphatase class I N-terminal domain-containing protein n=1 Tax=Teladorsagia circumcincta TaxID=45464 RepID=A0A2G9UD88_TELCI|nr:hypothetical protein TELCIR_10832 [Teladorsagia circumcincta]